MQLMNVPCHAEVHSESNVPDHLWDWWNDDQQRQWLHKFNPGTIVTHGTSMGLWLPALDINRITAGISGIAGMPMVGIRGHLGLLVAMMMIGGRRGHNGTVNQRSISTKVLLQNGTELILRKQPGASIVAH